MTVDAAPESIPLAIIGMGCRLPGADDLGSFWSLISEGRCAISEMPADRMDRELYYDPRKGVRGKSYSTLAATLSSRVFDREACPIPEELARGVDNSHLLMCGVAAEALRHAGLDPFNVPLRNTGVYIGHAQGSELGCDYTYATCVAEAAEFLREVPVFQQLPADKQSELIQRLVSQVRGRLPRRTPQAPDVSACMVAGTISKAFGLSGPFLAINSACASSLQAMLLGARALQLGHVDMAIVGGASDCKGDSLVLFAHAQAMSATGSRPFDADADGLIVGEGYVAVVMKRLDRALSDGDNVLAVVRGLGISSDGRGKSLWAPRKEGQIKAMERAYRAGVDMSQLQYLEAHSTATQLGDATELNTLSEVLAPHFPAGHKIPVTSVKANIGHTLESAGLAGVIKTVLCMQHGEIPPAVNVSRLNPNIDWDNAPVYVPLSAKPWPAPAGGLPRRAGINAFGIGGLNMHVVLDEYTESSRMLIDPAPASRSVVKPQGTDNSGRGDDDAIAVIGRGCIFPGAGNLAEFWRLLQSGEDPKQLVPADRWRSDLASQPHNSEAIDIPCMLGGFITGYEHDWRRHKIPPKQIQQADPLQFMLLDAMDEAFVEAGYDNKEFDRERVGVVVGTEFGGDFAFQLQLGLRIPELQRIIKQLLAEQGLDAAQTQAAAEQYAEALLAHWPALIDETGSFSTSTLASRLGKTWNLMGGAAAIDAGDASSLSALAVAADMLLAGDCDMMVCAGGQRRMGLPEYEMLSLRGLLSRQEPRSPLDAACDGYVPGEGVGVVLLKRLADARRDGDPIHSIIRGIASAHDHDGAQATQLMLERSFSTAGSSAAELVVVELDATGSAETTERQLSAIAASQRAADRDRPLLVSSVASQIGHTQGAAGIASLLKASLEVSHGEVPRTHGVPHPDSAMNGHSDTLRCAADRTAIAGLLPNKPVAAAVVSYSRGLTYQAIVQSGERAGTAAAHFEQPSVAAIPDKQEPIMTDNATTPTIAIENLESFLINFVVEQTGYPPEVVELDADLEADLGIDSIKKAQLFGELQEYFDITPTGDVTLDDFPTLRHVLDFLAAHSATPANRAGETSAPHTQSADAGPQNSPLPPLQPSYAPPATSGGEGPGVRGNQTDAGSLPLTPARVQWSSPTMKSLDHGFPQSGGEGDHRAKIPANAARIMRYGGSSWAEIEQQFKAAASDPESAFQNAVSGHSFSPRDRCRAAIVADGPAALAAKLEQAAKCLQLPAARRPLENQGVFLREVGRQQPRIAFVFPGQGSQYAGMLRPLVEQDAEARAAVNEINAVLTQQGESSFAEIAWHEDSPLGTDVWTTQLAMLLADQVMLRVLSRRGITPGLVMGHSYGEYPALIAAGAWDLAEAIRVTRARCDGIEASLTSQGGMLATSAPPEEITELARQLSDQIFIANLNAPDQTVVGGRRPAVRELERLLKARSHYTRLLPVPCAFHTPLMQDAVPPLEESLRNARIESPQVMTYSVANNRQVKSADDVRQNLVDHMTHPVMYADLIRDIAGQAPTVFVEVGPQQALTRLNARILSDGEPDLIACDHPKRPGPEQLLHVQALLEVCGVLDRSASVEASPVRLHEIIHFDATARRRAKMREAAGQKVPVAAAPAEHTAEQTTPVPARPCETAAAPKVVSPNGLPLPPRVGQSPTSAPAVTASLTEPVAVSAARPSVVTPTVAALTSASLPDQAATSDSSAPDMDDLESFLINFVVEQTGYPPEVVELDADLEADLGIDSIKKAQLFGELQEYFDITPTAGVTLDDFPTLRHVVRFLAETASPTMPAEPAEQAAEAYPTNGHMASELASAPKAAPVSQVGPRADVPVIQLRGTSYEIGRQHGIELQEPIRRALRRIADLSGGATSELPLPRNVFTHPEQYFEQEVLDELHGMADGAGVSIGSLLAWNLLLLTELGTSADHIAVAGNRSETGTPLHGLRDDLCLMGALSDCLAPAVMIREEAGQIPYASVTFAGFVGGLAGFNAQRVAVSGLASDAAPRRDDVLPGRHLLMVPQLLRTAKDLPTAEQLLGELSDGQWSCCLSHVESDSVLLARHDGQQVSVTSSTDLLSTGGHAPEERFSQPQVSIATMQAMLHPAKNGGGRSCTVILDAAAGDLYVSCGESGGTQELMHIPVAQFFGPVTSAPPTIENGSRPTDAPAYDLPEEVTQTQRFVMKMVPSELSPESSSKWVTNGPALILGNNRLADALARRLNAEGVPVHQLPAADLADTISELERLWKQGSIPHLFLTTARDDHEHDLSDPAVWQQRWDEQVLTPYFVCQRWLQLADEARCVDDCSVVAVTNLGGDFGFNGDVQRPLSGGLTGLMKALCLEYFVLREHKGFLSKAIDAPPNEDPESLAESIYRELASGALDYEVAYVDGRRALQLAVPRPAPVQELSEIWPGSTWVVTGGVRGITAASALELGRRFQLKLHLLGSSPMPDLPADKRDLDAAALETWRSEVMVAARAQGVKPNVAWEQVQKSLEMDRTLRQFHEAGIDATYHCCDVGDRDALAAVLEKIRRTDGPIAGILHGAGVERPCRFEKKTPENVRATLDAKVSGAYHLMTLTRQDPIRHFLAYGSISGRLGSNGQTDYCVASDLLCKLVTWYRGQRSEVRAAAFHWHPWDEVGMAARPETRASLARTNGPSLMPKWEGLRHLISEVYAPQEQCEVLITDWEFHQRYYPEHVRHSADESADVPRIASRQVLRMADAPLPEGIGTAITGSAIILGQNPAALALRERLVSRGVKVHVLPSDDNQATLSELESIWSQGPCRNLFLMTAREPDSTCLFDPESLRRRTERCCSLPYLVTQRWVQLLSSEEWSTPAVVVAATSLGGEFGFQGAVPVPESGALCGLLKSIHVENVRSDTRRFLVKVVDAPASEPAEQLAESICREVESGTPEVEVAWSHGRRRTVQCRRESLKNVQTAVPRQGGVWVVTGGARGITAVTALELGRRYGLKLHLVGKSPAPDAHAAWRNVTHAELKLLKRQIVMRAVSEGRSPEDDWDRVRKDREIFDSLQAFAGEGVDASYHSCDIADREALGNVLRQIRDADGPIEGIIHGAGYAKSARFETQSLDRVRRTLAPKLDGTVALMALTQVDPLKSFIAFGSLSGRFGGNGLADYAAANDALAKLCDWHRRQRPDCRTSCMHWQTWDRIGMAMIADGIEITKNAFKMEFIPPEEGVAHLHDELLAGLPEGEVLISDGYFQQVFYPEASRSTDADDPDSRPAVETLTADPSSAPSATLRPLVDRWERNADGVSSVATVSFDPSADPFLSQHRLRDKPFLPAVVGIEALLQAAALVDPAREVRTIHDIEITNGLIFHAAEPVSATVHVAPTDGSLTCRLTTELRNRQGKIVDPERLHVSGVVDLTEPLPLPDAPGRPSLGWFPHQYSDDGLLTHGPAYRCLSDIAYQYDGGWGRIVAPHPQELAGSRPEQGWILPLAVLDACLVTCGSFVFLQFGGQIEVPHGFEMIRCFRPPRAGESCIVRTYFRGRDERHSRFDFALFGDGDEPLLQAMGYRTIRIGGNS